MSRTTVTSCHSLKLIPLSRLSRFARINSRVIMQLSGEADDAMAVPGSIKISASTEEGTVKKKITFERSDVSAASAEMLDRYRVVHLVATYTDESGQQRVAGSPDWPLSLDYSTSGGVFSVTLEGEDTAPDAFLMC